MPTMTSTNMKLLAVLIAAGIPVETYRMPGRSQTIVGEFPDETTTRQLIQDYERRLVVKVPQKAIMQAYVELGYERKRLMMEGF